MRNIKIALVISVLVNILVFYRSYTLWNKATYLNWSLQNCEKKLIEATGGVK